PTLSEAFTAPPLLSSPTWGGGSAVTRIAPPLGLHRPVRDLEALVDDVQALLQLGLGDAQRRVGEEAVPAHQGVEPLLAEELAEGGHLLGGAVVGGHGLVGLAVAHELDDSEEAEVAVG